MLYNRLGTSGLVVSEIGMGTMTFGEQCDEKLSFAIMDRAYDVIARNRYRLFGRFEQCLAPRPEFRGRFIE